MLNSTLNLRQSWLSTTPTTNAWLALPSPFIAELTSRAGFDSLCFDMQHGLIDYAACIAMLQAASASNTPTLVRVPWNEPSTIMRVLDGGATGVIVPMINTADDARAVVQACRYPPLGQRSYGPVRAAITHGPDYFAHANDAVPAFAMIETRQGLDDLEAILAVEGLDGVYIGPADLSLALGMQPLIDNPNPDHQEVVRRIITAAHAHGRFVGLHCASATFAAQAAGWGVNFATIATDTTLLRAALHDRVAEFRALLER